MLESVEDDASAEFDRAGYIHQHVDLLGARQQEGVFRNHRLSGADGILHLALRSGYDGVFASGVGEHIDALAGRDGCRRPPYAFRERC